jgi:hypothetical protein
MDDDIAELLRLRRLRTNLELPAYLFERLGGSCRGDCESPLALIATVPEAITCCNLHPVWEYWSYTRRLERGLSKKIQQVKAA